MPIKTDFEEPKELSPEERLAQIGPVVPRPRFLISWDAPNEMLWYGLGSGPNAVRVSSAGHLDSWDRNDAFGARLPKTTVEKFLNTAIQIDGGQLLNSCRSVLEDHVYFADSRLYTLVAVWAIASHLYPIFGHFGYLFFHSKLWRSGKTRVEEVLSHLAFEACPPVNAPTVPTIRESAREGRTLVLDTLERWKAKSTEAYSAAMEFFDAGFRNGASVSMMETDAYGKWRKVSIPVYAPYVLAGIHRGSLADTALDRSFVIEMHRKPRSIKKKKYNFEKCDTECRLIRERVYVWALQNAATVADSYADTDLETEVDTLGLNDRAADIWQPLFATLRALGASNHLAELKELAREMAIDPEVAEDEKKLKIVRVLRSLPNPKGTLVATTTMLLKRLAARGVKIGSPKQLHKILDSWGFKQKSVRTSGATPCRAWKIDVSRLEEIEQELGVTGASAVAQWHIPPHKK